MNILHQKKFKKIKDDIIKHYKEISDALIRNNLSIKRTYKEMIRTGNPLVTSISVVANMKFKMKKKGLI